VPVAITIQEVLDYVGSTTATSPRLIYGVSVPDATISARGINPAVNDYGKLLSESTITANQALANEAAKMRAVVYLLRHVRTMLMTAGPILSYSIGNMSVTRANLIQLIEGSVMDAERDESRRLALLISPGSQQAQRDLTIENPIATTTDGVDAIHLDAPPPYTGW
jgi:hypothetical protein